MSSPSSTPWRRATPSGCSSRGTRRRNPSDEEAGSCAGVRRTVPVPAAERTAQPRPLATSLTPPPTHPPQRLNTNTQSAFVGACVPSPGLVLPVLSLCRRVSCDWLLCYFHPCLTSDGWAAAAGACCVRAVPIGCFALCKMGRPDFLLNIVLNVTI